MKAKWGKMIEDYLHQSKEIRCVFLLIDIRHEPTQNDKIMYQWILDHGYEPVIIATKLDKIKRSQLQKQMKLIREGLDVVRGTKIIPFSAETKQGREEIWELIDSLVLPEEETLGVKSDSEQVEMAAELLEKEIVAEPEKPKKQRWKAAGKETAKKTKRLQDKKAAKNSKKKR